MTNQKPPREWWINPREFCLNRERPYYFAYVEALRRDHARDDKNENIHVIEKSYADSLASQLEAANAEIKKLKRELADYEHECETINEMRQERDRAHAEVERLKALEKKHSDLCIEMANDRLNKEWPIFKENEDLRVEVRALKMQCTHNGEGAGCALCNPMGFPIGTMNKKLNEALDEVERLKSLEKVKVSLANMHYLDSLEAERDELRSEVDRRTQDIVKLTDQTIALTSEVEQWKAKYIEARKSGYEEGMQEAAGIRSWCAKLEAALESIANVDAGPPYEYSCEQMQEEAAEALEDCRAWRDGK